MDDLFSCISESATAALAYYDSFLARGRGEEMKGKFAFCSFWHHRPHMEEQLEADYSAGKLTFISLSTRSIFP